MSVTEDSWRTARHATVMLGLATQWSASVGPAATVVLSAGAVLQERLG